MTQTERRIFLITYLLDEAGETDVTMPTDAEEQKVLLRGLLNVRGPKPISDEFLRVQDEYLTERKNEKGVVTLADIAGAAATGGSTSRMGGSVGRAGSSATTSPTAATSLTGTQSAAPAPLIWQGDITRLEVDAIVNAANSGMTGCYGWNHLCIDNAIHTFAGVQLRLECAALMEQQGFPEPTGRAKITGAYNLPAKHVIHTVGPIVQGKLNERHRLGLRSCYRECLEIAAQNGCASIAFCCISTGVFMFPKEEAARIAVETVREFLAGTDGSAAGGNSLDAVSRKSSASPATPERPAMQVVFNVFSDEDRLIYEQLLNGGTER